MNLGKALHDMHASIVTLDLTQSVPSLTRARRLWCRLSVREPVELSGERPTGPAIRRAFSSNGGSSFSDSLPVAIGFAERSNLIDIAIPDLAEAPYRGPTRLSPG